MKTKNIFENQETSTPVYVEAPKSNKGWYVIGGVVIIGGIFGALYYFRDKLPTQLSQPLNDFGVWINNLIPNNNNNNNNNNNPPSSGNVNAEISVTDSAGYPIKDAVITIKNSSTKVAIGSDSTNITNDAGILKLKNIPMDYYDVTINHPAYTPQSYLRDGDFMSYSGETTVYVPFSLTKKQAIYFELLPERYNTPDGNYVHIIAPGVYVDVYKISIQCTFVGGVCESAHDNGKADIYAIWNGGRTRLGEIHWGNDKPSPLTEFLVNRSIDAIELVGIGCGGWDFGTHYGNIKDIRGQAYLM